MGLLGCGFGVVRSLGNQHILVIDEENLAIIYATIAVFALLFILSIFMVAHDLLFRQSSQIVKVYTTDEIKL